MNSTPRSNLVSRVIRDVQLWGFRRRHNIVTSGRPSGPLSRLVHKARMARFCRRYNIVTIRDDH